MTTFSRPPGYARRTTREVKVGDVGVGGRCPIRVQSMTTPATHDVEATVAQIRRLAEAGCEIVRVTVPSTRDAEALPEIRRRLSADGIRVPLVADIHFSPAAAMLAVEHVEKVRINPGNYADTKRFKIREYSDAEYQAELERIEQRFRPLVLRAKQRGVSLRIGTNHGSLSDRILNRYGDTPLGMVESALEFVRICARHSFHEIILSMKSSNPMVMIQAYRLLAERMRSEEMDYPFHLGVTEAGDGEDGRVKSAIGIGSLLEDGIGDTVRVSLTEDPVAEVPVAFGLVEKYNAWLREGTAFAPGGSAAPPPESSTYRRIPSDTARFGGIACGAGEPVRVESLLVAKPEDGVSVRAELESLRGAPAAPDARAEVIEVDSSWPDAREALGEVARLVRGSGPQPALSIRLDPGRSPLPAPGGLRELAARCDRVTLRLPPGADNAPEAVEALAVSGCRAAHLQLRLPDSPGISVDPLVAAATRFRDLAGTVPLVSLETPPGISPVPAYRLLSLRLREASLPAPILLVANPAGRGEDPLLFCSTYLGSLLCDGIGDAVRVERFGTPADSLRLAFNILQGTRLRLFKTEFISCPSCGRTQFDLEETTRRIKAGTSHLKGVKIAIMGCIVNGPGEMADADFGYVGWGPGKVALFVGKDLVEKDIPFAEADDRLIRLIRERGRWIEPGSPETAPGPVQELGGS